MKNKNVGYLICGIALVILAIIFLFNKGMTKIVSTSCSHGTTCPMYGTIATQTWLSVAIAVIVLIIGIFMILSKEEKEIITKRIKEKKAKHDLSKLERTEKEIVKLLEKEGGAIFQATLMEKLNVGKVGITRMLDKLESKQIIERKRRGMNNIVVLK